MRWYICGDMCVAQGMAFTHINPETLSSIIPGSHVVDASHVLELHKKLCTLRSRKNEHLLALGVMISQIQRPVPPSLIPHPLCNWTISRVAAIDKELEILVAEYAHEKKATYGSIIEI